jgi:uncharacterized protein YkwD
MKTRAATARVQPAAGAALLASCLLGSVAAQSPPPVTAAVASAPQRSADTLQRINALRAAGAHCGSKGYFAPAPALAWHDALERTAQQYAAEAAQRGDVAHLGLDGAQVGERVLRQGYAWWRVGENLAAGRDTVEATLAQWMHSPAHCANLMNPDFFEVAMAGSPQPGTRYGWYWVMVLGTRMPNR